MIRTNVVRRHHGSSGAYFDCVSGSDGAWLKLVLKGEIDLAAVQQLEGQIGAVFSGTEKDVVLDLAGVSFIDSTGLRMLLRITRQVEQREGQLVVGRLSRPVDRLLGLAGLSDFFAFLDGSSSNPVCPICERAGEFSGGRCPHCGSGH